MNIVVLQFFYTVTFQQNKPLTDYANHKILIAKNSIIDQPTSLFDIKGAASVAGNEQQEFYINCQTILFCSLGFCNSEKFLGKIKLGACYVHAS